MKFFKNDFIGNVRTLYINLKETGIGFPACLWKAIFRLVKIRRYFEITKKSVQNTQSRPLDRALTICFIIFDI